MSYDWLEYLVYARLLLTHGPQAEIATQISKETVRRVVAGRAYYAMYNLTLKALPNYSLESMCTYYIDSHNHSRA